MAQANTASRLEGDKMLQLLLPQQDYTNKQSSVLRVCYVGG